MFSILVRISPTEEEECTEKYVWAALTLDGKSYVIGEGDTITEFDGSNLTPLGKFKMRQPAMVDIITWKYLREYEGATIIVAYGNSQLDWKVELVGTV